MGFSDTAINHANYFKATEEAPEVEEVPTPVEAPEVEEVPTPVEAPVEKVEEVEEVVEEPKRRKIARRRVSRRRN